MEQTKKLRLGMIGGGPGSMIGEIHRYAARLDNHYDLIAGAFSRDLRKSQQTGEELGLLHNCVYATAEELLQHELDVVTIVTPTDTHFAIAKKALEAGVHVIIDKPVTYKLSEAQALQKIITQQKKLFCITYTYAGYPMVKEARQIIQSGRLGKIKKVMVEFMQGWLATLLEATGHKQAAWRMDASLSPSGTMADIGTHAFHLAEYVTGLKTTHLCADLNKSFAQRELDDDGAVLMRFDNDARGVLIASQIAAGEEVDINIRVYGELGGLQWKHTEPDVLTLKFINQPIQVITAGRDKTFLHPATLSNCRTPAGHPEAYVAAFANHYRNFALSIKQQFNPIWDDYPKIADGIRGAAFIEVVIASAATQQKWLRLAV